MKIEFNKKIIISILVGLLIILALIKVITIISEPQEVSQFKSKMKEKGYNIKSISASTIAAEDVETNKIIEAAKYDSECILVQFKDGINADIYFETMYLATKASGMKVKMLNQSNNFLKVDTTDIENTSDKMVSKENNQYVVYSREGKMLLIVFSNSEYEAISLSEELGY